MIQKKGYLRKVLQNCPSVSLTRQRSQNSWLYRTDLWSSFASVGKIDDKLRYTGDKTRGPHVSRHLRGFDSNRSSHCHEHAVVIRLR